MEQPNVNNRLKSALLVMTLTPHIRAYLEAMDPQALKQASEALTAIGANPDPEPHVYPQGIEDFTKVWVTGVACESGRGKVKTALSHLLLVAGKLGAEIGLYEGGLPFEKKLWSIIGSFQKSGDVPVAGAEAEAGIQS